jgi:signal transduction histidine kinase
VRDISEQVERARQHDKFARMVSHEFRTPLSTIDGAIQRLEMTGANADEATRKRYRKIQTAVDRLLELLNEYLSPERLASIGRTRQADEIAPAVLLETAAEQARARRSPITVQVENLPPWMRCDPQGMRLCLDVLLDNAIKYTNDNVAIELQGKPAPEGGIEFLVIDHGAALPDAELLRVFERGYRGSAAAGQVGSGLGLYMAKAIVDVHGGTLSVENLPEGGKKFRIWLPIAA